MWPGQRWSSTSDVSIIGFSWNLSFQWKKRRNSFTKPARCTQRERRFVLYKILLYKCIICLHIKTSQIRWSCVTTTILRYIARKHTGTEDIAQAQDYKALMELKYLRKTIVLAVNCDIRSHEDFRIFEQSQIPTMIDMAMCNNNNIDLYKTDVKV